MKLFETLNSQKGFVSQVALVLVLAAGVGLGTYLVQQRTNLTPFASEEDCKDNPVDPPSTSDSDNFSYKWKANCSRSCQQNSDCPQNDDDPNRVNPDTSNWCYGFGDGGSQPKCMMLVSVNKSTKNENKSSSSNNSGSSNSSGSSDPRDEKRNDSGNCRNNPVSPPSSGGENFSYLWKADCTSACQKHSDCAQNTSDKDRVDPKTSNWCYGFGDGSNRCMMMVTVDKDSGKENTSSFKPMNNATTGTGGSGNAVGTNQACTVNTTQTYFDQKVANRYARFLAIIKGIPEYCVQADLGALTAPITANSADVSGNKDGAINDGRLYLCSGKNNTKEKLDLVWRVVSSDGKDLRRSDRNDPGSDMQNVKEVMYEAVVKAESMLGVTSPAF